MRKNVFLTKLTACFGYALSNNYNATLIASDFNKFIWSESP